MAKTKAEQEHDEVETHHRKSAHEPPPETPSPLNRTLLEQAAARAQAAEDDKKALEQLRAIDGAEPAKRKREDMKKKAEAEQQDRESRTVRVRVLPDKKGFYPADGRIRNEGDVFDYVLAKDVKGKLETEVPSWVEDVDGKYKTHSIEIKPLEPSKVMDDKSDGANDTSTKEATK